MTAAAEDRIRAVLAQTEPTAREAALLDAATALRDEGLGQRELFFAVNRVRESTDEDDVAARDALEFVLDRVSGWCEPRHRLYP